MILCSNNHTTICYEGEGYTCPLCAEIEDNRLLRGEIEELKYELKSEQIKVVLIQGQRDYLVKQLKEKEKCLCKVSTE